MIIFMQVLSVVYQANKMRRNNLMIESKFEYNYYCIRFIWFILLVYLAFMGFLGLASINYSHENKNQFMDEIPAYIVPEKLDIMTWYDPKIDEEYLKKRRYQ